jgi:hypothetical protein
VKIFMPANRVDGTGVERTLNAVILGHRLARKTHQQTSPRVTADLRCSLVPHDFHNNPLVSLPIKLSIKDTLPRP